MPNTTEQYVNALGTCRRSEVMADIAVAYVELLAERGIVAGV